MSAARSTEVSKARDNYDRYAYCRDNGHTAFVAKANLCERFYQGLQWDEKIRRRLEAAGKPVLTINQVLATLNFVMGEQINNRADITFAPFDDGIPETASALAKTYLQIANANRLHWKESEMFDDGVITSRGFLDVRMKFDRQMRGEVDVAVLNPKNVVIDSDADKYDPDEWKEVFITKWMTPEKIEAVYGSGKAKLLKGKDESSFDLGYDSLDEFREDFSGDSRNYQGDRPKDKKRFRVIERQYRKSRLTDHFVDPVTGDTRVVPQSWSKSRVKRTQAMMGWRIRQIRKQQIRWRVTADSVVLFDDWSPYQHFTVVPYFPFFRRGTTMGVAEHLVSVQEMINKVGSQEIHVVNSSANGGWKIKRGALHNMDPDELEQRGAETGLVLELTDTGDAEKITPNQIPTGLDRLTYKLEEYVKSISNVTDSMRGFDREDVAARAIKEKRAAGSTSLVKPLDNLTRTRYLLARNILCLIQQYYTEERVLKITGDRPGSKTEEIPINQMTPEGVIVNDLTIGTYDVVVSSTRVRDSYNDTQFEEAKALRDMGLPIPDEVLIESSNLERKNEIVEQMRNNPSSELAAKREQLELAELEQKVRGGAAEAERKAAETQLAQARAGKTQVDAQKTQVDTELAAMEAGSGADPNAEVMLQREKMLMEIELKRQEMLMNMQLKREEMKMNMRLKMAEAEERLANQPAPWEKPPAQQRPRTQ